MRWDATLIFVTHDRVFLRKLATRILEIDRGHLFDWCCDYDTFVERKEAALAAQEKQDALFDKKLATEEVWIRQGIKARRTRNEGRVRALEKMRRERQERRVAHGDVRIRIEQGRRSGNLVVDVEDVSFSYKEQSIVDGFSTTVMRGDKIGIIGPNGIGKTTLLRILLGQLPPQKGTVRLGTNVEVAYFDQLREQLDEEATVQENVGQGYESIQIGGTSRHIIGYLRDFLFSPERARTPVRFLSGGERNRVLLARLFARPANVIVLDEPTNDLDSETLDMLEQRLVAYEGTVLLVSHDRAFLNNVVTSTIVFEPSGVKEYFGGYDDWLRQRADRQDTTAAKKAKPPSGAETTAKRQQTSHGEKPPKRRLSFQERKELAALPAAIEQFEADIAELHHVMTQPEFYQRPGEQIARERKRLDDLESRLATAYLRWEELERCVE
jgi:ATP-binding cassette subfamily F protein uup